MGWLHQSAYNSFLNIQYARVRTGPNALQQAAPPTAIALVRLFHQCAPTPPVHHSTSHESPDSAVSLAGSSELHDATYKESAGMFDQDNGVSSDFTICADATPPVCSSFAVWWAWTAWAAWQMTVTVIKRHTSRHGTCVPLHPRKRSKCCEKQVCGLACA